MASSVEHMRQGGAQPNVQQSAGAQPVNQAENDPIYRFKLLLPRLKESLVVSIALNVTFTRPDTESMNNTIKFLYMLLCLYIDVDDQSRLIKLLLGLKCDKLMIPLIYFVFIPQNLMKIAGTCLHHNSQQLEDSTYVSHALIDNVYREIFSPVSFRPRCSGRI